MPTESRKPNKKILFYSLLAIGAASFIVAATIGFNIFQKVGHRPPPIPRQTNLDLIQEWMTVPFIARSYRVPDDQLFVELGINSADRKLNLADIAKKTNRNSTDLLTSVKQAIKKLQMSSTSPP